MIYLKKNILLNSGLFLVFLLLQSYVNAQSNINFQAYGQTPNSINDSLHIVLKNAITTDEKATILFKIANQHVQFGNADSIVHYGNLLKDLEKNNNLNKARGYNFLGRGKFLNGLFDAALKAYIDGITFADLLDDSAIKNQFKLGLGQIYFQRKDFIKASEYFVELKDIKEENNIGAKASSYLGSIAFEENNPSLAKDYYNEAINKLPLGESSKLKLTIKFYLGKLAEKEGKDEDALTIYEIIMNTSLNNNYFDIYTEAVLEYGRICTKLEQFQVAEMTLSVAYTNAIQWNRLELQKKIIYSLQSIYREKEDYQNAYNLMTQYLSISNEIIKQQKSKAIRDIEIKYQTVQKENEIYQLKEEQLAKQNEINRQKTIKKAFLYGFLALLIPIIALLFVYYQKLQAQSLLNKQQEELNSQKIAGLLNSQELELARTSLDAQQEERHRIAKQLHDSIGGNLAGIKLQISSLKENSKFQKDVMKQVNETYELVRDISHNLVPKKFQQNAFTFLLKNYIEQLKTNSDIEIAFSAHPKQHINNLSEKLKIELYQIIQELFTNTIKHANAKNIEAHLNIHDAMFQLIFEDDGDGFDVNSLRKGIGLQNIESRLQQLNGNIVLDSAPKRGTVITIEIPLKY